MVIGTLFLGKVKEVNKQWIETKFFVLGLPLFPFQSMLVFSSRNNVKQGIIIPLNPTSIVAGYARLLTFIAAVICLIYGLFDPSGNDGIHSEITMWGIVALLLWAFFFFWLGKPSQEEIVRRSKLGKTMGVYALPHWFDFDTSLNNLRMLELEYKTKFENSNWQSDLSASDTNPDKAFLFYPLAIFTFLIDPSMENEQLVAKAEALLS